MNKKITENFYTGYIDYLRHSLEIHKTKEGLKNAIENGFVAKESAYVTVADYLIESLNQYYCNEEFKSEIVLKDIDSSNVRSIKCYSKYIDGVRDIFMTGECYEIALKEGRLASECGYYSVVDFLQVLLVEDKNKTSKTNLKSDEMSL